MLMADAVVNYLVKKFGDLILQEADNLHGTNDQLEWLKRQQRRMQCFLKDADAKESQRDDERFKNLVTDIRDLAFEVEKVINTCPNSDLRDFIDRIIWRLKAHKRVRGIRDKMLELYQSKILFGIANIGETKGTTSYSITSEDRPSILPQLNDDDIDKFGFDEEKKIIVQQLVDTSNTNRSVISIVDMDGKRKIALVGAIYNDPKVEKRFDLVLWITISQKYTIIEILKNILSRVPGTSSIDAIEILAVTLINELKKYKYLIILVDVWEENVWDQLQNFFPDVNNGSRVIITTRFSNVSSLHFRGECVHQGRNYTQAVSPSLQSAKTELDRRT
ncbi:disease resistance protein RPP13-like [Dioscorea cayenensis subsp. rotundata]|uniref:Disease resistance protein RPP13-like n=1 Tax=Dioscorea cayennensis subsp. rotundata TaxID=55577 RepID=A0AB40AZZ5_DIOCR|nr:disease resistance protein RPP13-like [Dioscorea cayenensis subsp. rotundata]